MEKTRKPVFILNAEPEESDGIARLLEMANCPTQTVRTPSRLKELLKKNACMAVIMDIDSVAVDNRTIRELASAFPAIPLLCLSKERFHPELKDSIRDLVYACLTKPIDPVELSYWIKCIREDSPHNA
jgi:DNA-binding NtrC family response regulator